MKKIILILLSVLLVAALMSVPVYAAGGTAAVSTVTGQPDEQVELFISLSGFGNADSVAIRFSYENGLVLDADKSGWLIDGTLDNLDATGMKAVWGSENAQDVNKDVLKLVFTVPEPVEDQEDLDYTVSCTVEVMNGAQSLGRVNASGKVTLHNPAKTVALNKSAATLEPGATETLTALRNPANATEKITWTSSDPTVATVENGVVTALKAGTTTIRAAASQTAYAECEITVICRHSQKTSHARVEPKCNATGMQAYYTCDSCGAVLKSDGVTQTTLDALKLDTVAHTGGTATCTQKAVCTWCQQEYGQTLPHSFGTAWLSDGTNHWHKCENCSATADTAAHSYQWRVDKEATEDATGLKHEECVCGVKRSENTVISKLDHKHIGITYHKAVKATCVKAGTVEHWTCSSSKCTGKYYADAKCQLELKSITEAINKDNHTGGTQIKDAVEATCSKAGYSGDTYCTACKKLVKKGQEVPATGKHTPGEQWFTDDNNHWRVCSAEGCGAVVDQQAHSYQWKTDKKATEEATGLKHEECACGLKRSENTVVPKLEHAPVLVEGKEPTCTEDGAAEHYLCYNCGRYYASTDGKAGDQISKDEITLKATGHSFDTAWQTDDKSHWHVCACGETSEKEAHKTELVGVKEATETETGYTGDEVCSVCELVVKEGQEIPVLSTEEPTEPAPADTEPAGTDGQQEENKGGAILWIAVIAALGAGAVIFFLIPVLKKRKSDE